MLVGTLDVETMILKLKATKKPKQNKNKLPVDTSDDFYLLHFCALEKKCQSKMFIPLIFSHFHVGSFNKVTQSVPWLKNLNEHWTLKKKQDFHCTDTGFNHAGNSKVINTFFF